MSKSGIVRLGLTALFGLLFLIVFLTLTFRPSSTRCKISQIEKNWEINFTEKSELIYSRQSGFSIFGEGNYYSIIQMEAEMNTKDEYHILEEEEVQTVSDWYTSCGLDIEKEFQYSFDQQYFGKILQKEDDIAIVLLQNEKKQIFVLQSFR